MNKVVKVLFTMGIGVGFYYLVNFVLALTQYLLIKGEVQVVAFKRGALYLNGITYGFPINSITGWGLLATFCLLIYFLVFEKKLFIRTKY